MVDVLLVIFKGKLMASARTGCSVRHQQKPLVLYCCSLQKAAVCMLFLFVYNEHGHL